MTELLPCPFCGYKPRIHGDELFGYIVHCLTVGCPANPSSNCRKTEQEAIEAWNTRTDSFKVPDGYVLLPATTLNDARIWKSQIDGSVDISQAVNAYIKYLSENIEHELVTQSLNKAGWYKEQTCEGCVHESQKRSSESCYSCTRINYNDCYEVVSE